MAIAVLCLFAPGAMVADEGEIPSGLWAEIQDWLAAFIEESVGCRPEALGVQPPGFPANEPEVSILIPPGG